MSSRTVLVGLVFAAVILAGLVKYRAVVGDYPVYAAAAERMLHGDQVYLRSGDPRATTAPFTYPPFFVLPFIPLVGLPWAVQKGMWFLISLAALAGVLWLVRKNVAPAWQHAAATTGRRGPPEWVFWTALGVLVGRYVLAGFEVQTHDMLVILLVTLGSTAWCRGQEARAGGWLGLAAACKATPLLFAPVLLWQRRFVAAGCLLASVTAATLLPDVLVPSNTGQPWVAIWYHTFLRDIRPGGTAEAPGGWQRWNTLNQGLAGTLYRLSNAPDPAAFEPLPDVSLWHPSPRVLSGVTLVMQVSVLGLVLAASWPPRRERFAAPKEESFHRFGQCGAVVCAMLLLSPMSSKAHFAALLLPLAFCLSEYLHRRRDPLLAAVFVALFLSSTLTVKGLLGKPVGDHLLAYGTVCWSTFLCLFASTWTLLRRHLPADRQRECISSPPAAGIAA